jgi:hypothetical protein
MPGLYARAQVTGLATAAAPLGQAFARRPSPRAGPERMRQTSPPQWERANASSTVSAAYLAI